MLEIMSVGGKRPSSTMDYPTFLSWLSAKNITKITKTANVNAISNSYSQAGLDTTGQLLMYGTPYGSRMASDSLIHSVMVHACPTKIIADELRANSRVCLYLVSKITSFPSYPALDRNGYLSRSYGTYGGAVLLDFVYYDASLGYMMRYNPSVMDTPVPFDGKLKAI